MCRLVSVQQNKVFLWRGPLMFVKLCSSLLELIHCKNVLYMHVGFGCVWVYHSTNMLVSYSSRACIFKVSLYRQLQNWWTVKPRDPRVQYSEPRLNSLHAGKNLVIFVFCSFFFSKLMYKRDSFRNIIRLLSRFWGWSDSKLFAQVITLQKVLADKEL